MPGSSNACIPSPDDVGAGQVSLYLGKGLLTAVTNRSGEGAAQKSLT